MQYNGIRKFIFSCRLHGKGTISLVHREKDMEKKITEVSYGDRGCESSSHSEALTLHIDLPEEIRGGMIFFRLKAETETQLYHAEFCAEDAPDRKISLSLVICTYKRKEYLEENLEKIRKDPELYKLFLEKHFIVRVVDNAKELPDSYGKGIQVYPNENTGGSGGFSRGMEQKKFTQNCPKSTTVSSMSAAISENATAARTRSEHRSALPMTSSLRKTAR